MLTVEFGLDLTFTGYANACMVRVERPTASSLMDARGFQSCSSLRTRRKEFTKEL